MLLGELMVRLGLNDSQYKSGIKDAKSDATDLSKHITSAFKVIGAAAVTGFGAAVTGSVMGASGLENYRNTLNVVMKDQKKAAETMAWAVKYANDTPFETDEVVDATVKLQSYGMVAKDVLPQIGDMAGVMNKSLDQAVEAIADAQTGELERLKEFGITKQQIIDHGNKIMRGKEIVNNKGQITDQKAFNKVLFSLMEERYKGGTALQATSFKGLMSTLSGTFKMTLAQMAGISETGEVQAGGFFDKLKQGVQSLNEQLDKWSKDGTLAAWAAGISSAFSAAFDFVVDLGKGIAGVVKYVKENIPISKQTINDFWESYKRNATEVSDFIKKDVIPTTVAFAKTVRDNMGSAKLDVGQLSDTFRSLIQVLKDLQGIFGTLARETIGVWFGQAVQGAMNLVNGLIGTIKAMLDMIHQGLGAINDLAHGRNPVYNSNAAPTPAPRAWASHGANANGTDYWRGGPTLIGEDGPEILNLPRGSQIIPNYKLKAKDDDKPQTMLLTVPIYLDSRKLSEGLYLHQNGRLRPLGVNT